MGVHSVVGSPRVLNNAICVTRRQPRRLGRNPNRYGLGESGAATADARGHIGLVAAVVAMDVEQGPASGKNDADVAVELSWHDVRYEVPLKDGTSKVIIDNASGNAKPGELLVIMGGSGGGKSTMLGYRTASRR